MKFIVVRTSTSFFGKDKKPIPEAVKESLEMIDLFNFEDDEDETHKDFWTIEINTLDELLSLFDNYGKIIIREANDYNDEPVGFNVIEIYDDYRE